MVKRTATSQSGNSIYSPEVGEIINHLQIPWSFPRLRFRGMGIDRRIGFDSNYAMIADYLIGAGGKAGSHHCSWHLAICDDSSSISFVIPVTSFDRFPTALCFQHGKNLVHLSDFSMRSG